MMRGICGWCGGPNYNCPCRDRDELRRMIGVALIVLGLCGVLAVSAHGQESAAPAADGGYRHATAGQPPAPAALTAGRKGPPRAPAADGEGAFARTEPAPSSPRHGARHQRAPLHVLLARVAVNEDARPLRPVSDGGTDGAPSADTRAILQTARAWATWQGVSVERAIRALAPHVSGSRPAKSARHAAYAALPARGADRPDAWVESAFGSWAVHGPRWTRLRAAVADLVHRPIAQCSGEPIAWGGPMDDAIAIRRGLVRLDCGAEVVNGYWGLPPERVLDASVAGGAR